MRLRFIFIVFITLAVSAVNGYNQQIKMWLDSADYDEDNYFPPDGIDTVVVFIHATDADDTANTPITVIGNVRYYVTTDTMMNFTGEDEVLIDDIITYETVDSTGFSDILLIPLDSLTLRNTPQNVIIIWPSLVNPLHPVLDSGFVVITVYIDNTIGIFEEQYQFGSTVFPNPSQGIQLLHIQSKHTQLIEHIEVMNMLGQPVFTKVYNENESGSDYMFPLAAYQSGVYYLHIFYRDGKHETVKFIKN